MTQEDIKKRVLSDQNVRRLNIRLGELIGTDENTRYALVKKELDGFISQALDTAFKEWKEAVSESMKQENIWFQQNCSSYKAYGALGHDIHAGCDCGPYQQAVDELNKKLQELGE